MDLSFQAVVLGVVQGLTEFVPISSSGHLVLVPWLFGWVDPANCAQTAAGCRYQPVDGVAFSVVVHMGTLLALLAYFWRDWARLIPAGLASIRDRRIGDDPDRRLGWLIVVATIPAVLVGPLLNDKFEELVREPAPVALMLCVGAAIMWLADRWGTLTRGVEGLPFVGALFIGVAQVVALVPGISRSGVSISAGLLCGLTRESAARFSFLMAAPVLGGAGLWEGRKILSHEAGPTELNVMIIGLVAAAISGLLAIRFMLEYLKRQPLMAFILYRVAAAVLVFVVLLSPHGA